MSSDLDFEPPRKMQKMNGKSSNNFYEFKRGGNDYSAREILLPDYSSHPPPKDKV